MARSHIVLRWSSMAVLMTCAPFNQVWASGFSLNEMSAASVGNAHAGGAAAAEDATTAYYNPAGLTILPGSQFSVTGSLLRFSAKFSDQGSLSGAGTPMTGGNGGNAGSWTPVPAMYYTTPLSPDLRFGIGIQSPFGLKTEYEAGWVGRYQALTSDMKTVSINPVFAWRANETLSVGGGVSAQYIDVKLSNAIDYGTICLGALGPSACVPAGYLPQERDGKVTMTGKDWSWGFNLGLLVSPTPDTRVGLAYRSRISHTLSGNASFSQPSDLPAPLAAAPSFTDSGAASSVELPESLNLSVHTDIDSRWSFMADAAWTRWSRVKELRISFDNGAPDSVTPENWRDTVRLSAALNYRVNDTVKLRGGIAYEPSAVKDEFRAARIPDADYSWLAFGAQFKLSKDASCDIGYGHLFVKNAAINHAEPPAGGVLTGEYKNSGNVLSAQLNYGF